MLSRYPSHASPCGLRLERLDLRNRPSLDLSEHLPYLINRVGSALVERFCADALARAHLSIASWRVLAVLATHGVLRQTDLAEMTSIEVSTLSRLITRLMRVGLVRRTRSRANGREVAVALTAKARGLLGKLVPVAAGLQDTAARGIAKRDLAMLRRLLRRMHANLTRQATEGDSGSPGRGASREPIGRRRS
jgi:DNA-binding MarR family transcriptional regulator